MRETSSRSPERVALAVPDDDASVQDERAAAHRTRHPLVLRCTRRKSATARTLRCGRGDAGSREVDLRRSRSDIRAEQRHFALDVERGRTPFEALDDRDAHRFDRPLAPDDDEVDAAEMP